MTNLDLECASVADATVQIGALTPGFIRFHFPEASVRELGIAIHAWKDRNRAARGRARPICAMGMRWPYPTLVSPLPVRSHPYLEHCFERLQADAVEAMLAEAGASAEDDLDLCDLIADIAAEALVSLRYADRRTIRSFRFLSARTEAPITWLRLAYALGCCSLSGQLGVQVATRGIATVGQAYAKWRMSRPGLDESCCWPRMEYVLSRRVSEAMIADAIFVAQPNPGLVPVERLWPPGEKSPPLRRLSPAAVEKRVTESPEPAPLRHLGGVLVP